MHVLAGDIGGTNTRLQISVCEAGRRRVIHDQRFESGAFDSLSSILQNFLKQTKNEPIEAVCLGIAGPVKETSAGQFVKVTNLPWEIHGHALAREFGFPKIILINDFQAIGYGIEALASRELVVLQKGESVACAPRALIGAGTGLGQGILIWQHDHYAPIATEGGHVEFGPTDALQIELAQYLIDTLGRTSYELILSGHGLVQLYAFLKYRGEVAESPSLYDSMKCGDAAAAISHAALEQNDPLAIKTLDLFVDIYGAQAGNLALTAGATGGIYIVGGIAPKVISRLTDGRFMQAFRNKGKMSPYVSVIPVQVAMNPDVGLIGAMLAGSRL